MNTDMIYQGLEWVFALAILVLVVVVLMRWAYALGWRAARRALVRECPVIRG